MFCCCIIYRKTVKLNLVSKADLVLLRNLKSTLYWFLYLEVLSIQVLLDRTQVMKVDMCCRDVKPPLDCIHEGDQVTLLRQNQLLLASLCLPLHPEQEINDEGHTLLIVRVGNHQNDFCTFSHLVFNVSKEWMVKYAKTVVKL